ncbi:MAG: GldG family protein, partial [Oscillospiraceae bacterium]|nr:GldG family protein [Oscillospiraceae bacterium]
PTAAVIQGHAEFALETFEALLRASNFDVIYINLSANTTDGAADVISGIPAGAALAVLAGPRFDLSGDELTALDKYMSGGGHAVIALDPSLPPLPNLEQYLTEWGARFDGAFVCDASINYGDPKLLLTAAHSTRMTDLTAVESRYLLLAGARPITPLWETDGNRVITPLFSSFETAYAKALDSGGEPSSTARAEGDAAGPFVLGAVCEQVRDGDSAAYAFLLPLSMLSDTALNMPNFLNRQLILHWMSMIQPDLVLDIMPRDTTDVPLSLNSREASVLFVLLVFAIPLAVFAVGGGVWLKRRKL